MIARVLVCGGRHYNDVFTVCETLDLLAEEHTIEVVIHGYASGADAHAAFWARSRGVKQAGFRAEWQKHGAAAGPLRNARMLKDGRPTVVVAFPGGKGTADMVMRARAAGVRVIEVPA